MGFPLKGSHPSKLCSAFFSCATAAKRPRGRGQQQAWEGGVLCLAKRAFSHRELTRMSTAMSPFFSHTTTAQKTGTAASSGCRKEALFCLARKASPCREVTWPSCTAPFPVAAQRQGGSKDGGQEELLGGGRICHGHQLSDKGGWWATGVTRDGRGSPAALQEEKPSHTTAPHKEMDGFGVIWTQPV